MNILNNILLSLTILICVFVVFKSYIEFAMKSSVPVKETVISDKLYMILIIITACIAVFIRVYKFGSVPGGFNQDGAMAAVDANALAHHGTDRYGMKFPVHFTAWGYGQMSVLLSYLMIPFIKLFGLNAITARMPQLLVSLAGLVCLYLLIKDIFGKKAALVAAIFAAINPWHIIQSRWALDCNLYAHFFIIGVYFLNKGLKKRLYLIISMIMFGLCMYCYGISIYTMPVFLLAAGIYLLVTKRLTIKDLLISAGVYLLVAWPFIATMVINFLKLPSIETPFFTIPYFPNSVRSNDILFFSDNFFGQLVSNFKSLMNVTFLQKPDLPWNAIDNFETMYLFSMPFVILGIIGLIKNHRKSGGAILILIFLLTGIWNGLTTNGVNINRINIVYYPIMIMAGIGIYYTIKLFSPAKWGILAAYLVIFILFSHTYFTSYADTMDSCFFKDFGEAVSSLKNEKADKYYITADSQYEGSSNVSEILSLFYLDIDSEYYQGKTNDGTLPFNQKYIFSSMKNLTINPNENAAYIITANDTQYFDLSKYNEKQFNNYYVLTPKN